MFPVMFAIGRTSGWIAQWKELVEDPEQKIARPRQIYTGERDLDYVPIRQRPLDHKRRAVVAQPLAILAVARPAALQQRPEAGRVVEDLQMTDLVPDDVEEDPLGASISRQLKLMCPVEEHDAQRVRWARIDMSR